MCIRDPDWMLLTGGDAMNNLYRSEALMLSVDYDVILTVERSHVVDNLSDGLQENSKQKTCIWWCLFK